MKAKILLGCAFLLWLIIAICFSSCSSSKKTTSKQSTLKDSVAVSSTTIEVKSGVTSTKKIDSSGLTVKDNQSEYEKVTEIILDSGYISDQFTINGNAEDYITKSKIKRITIYEKGKQTSKETQSVNKSDSQSTKTNTEAKKNTFDSTVLKTSETVVQKDKSRSSLWWLWLLIAGIVAIIYWKRDWLKGKMFGSTKG